MKDNTDRLFDALEHPERFSDAELQELFSDPSTRELYELMCKSADALAADDEPDIDQAWSRFSSRHTRFLPLSRRSIFRTALRRPVAAAIITIAASIAVAAATITITRTLSRSESTPQGAVTSAPTAATPAEEVADYPDTTAIAMVAEPEIIVFQNRTLEDIVDEIGRYYDATPTFRNANARALRLYFKWDQARTLAEVVEQLNSFEQIHITLNANNLTID